MTEPDIIQHISADHDPAGRDPADRDQLALRGGTAPVDVVVIGAGLAGLAAALTAARAGADVTVLDGHHLGGRAATTTVDPGVIFNGGPRAWYAAGPGAAVLDELGIVPRGGAPDVAHGRALRAGVLHPLPAGPAALLRTRLLSPRSKLAAALLLGRLDRVDAGRYADRSVAQWMSDERFAPDLCALLGLLIRTSSYCADLDHFSAEAAIRQLQISLGAGVRYLDGGFQQIVDSLVAAGRGAGVTILDRAPVTGVRRSSSEEPERTIDGATSRPRWHVTTTSAVFAADAVVIAAGGPASVSALCPVPIDSSGLGEPATAACLELAVRGPIAQPIVLGVDEPLYLSVHQPPADLAPAGLSVVHAMRYGARTSDQDRAALWDLAAIGGITKDRVVAHRFLRRMVVTGAIPVGSAGGLAGRPAVRVPDADGLFLAGDWIGPVGMLADAALASGRVAGEAAATVGRSVDVDRSAARAAGVRGGRSTAGVSGAG